MTNKENVELWVKAWKRAGPELERQRDIDVRTVDTQQSLASLAACFERAARDIPARAESGLVEQQRLFQRLRS